MRKFLNYLPLIALAAGFAATLRADDAKRVTLLDPAKSAQFEKAPKVAIVVGIGSYPVESGFGQLKYAVSDAQAVDAALTALGYKVKILTDSQATRNILRQTLENVHAMIDGNNGTVIFFFSGHGFQRNRSNFLATYESVLSDLASSGLAVKDIEDMIEKSGAPHRILWLDACRNDPGAGTRGASRERTFTSLSAEKGTLILYSAEASKVSYENDQLKHGVFTSFLIRGLNGEAAGLDGLITFDDMAGFITKNVREYSFVRGQSQCPVRAGESSGDLLVANKPIKITIEIAKPEGEPSIAIGAPKELRDRLIDLQARLETANSFFDQIKSANGGSLRTSIALSLNTAKMKISQATAEMNDGKYSDAQQSMNAAEQTLQGLEKLYMH